MNTAEEERRRERCRVFRQIGEEEGGGGGESSLALYANQQDPRAQMSHDHGRGRLGPAPCRHSQVRGAVSAQQ